MFNLALHFLYSLCFVCTFFMSAENKIKIGFLLREVSVRGVNVANFDYADCNETILGNESYVFLVNCRHRPLIGTDSIEEGRNMFKNRFKERFFECVSFDEVEQIIKEKGVDIFYNLKSGEIDEHISKNCKNAVHAVFNHFEVHGDVYATISDYLSQLKPELSLPYVPHMVRADQTTKDLRQELKIPKEAFVFGRHGGFTEFNINFARQAVISLARKNPNWYFLFMNTSLPSLDYTLPNIIHLNSTCDLYKKALFINTCDAMLHARDIGETFGLACAEFSIKNKPVITATYGDQSHSMILKDKGIYYSNRKELHRVLHWCVENKEKIRSANWDAYSQDFSPRKVMQKFDEVFIQPLIKKGEQ